MGSVAQGVLSPLRLPNRSRFRGTRADDRCRASGGRGPGYGGEARPRRHRARLAWTARPRPCCRAKGGAPAVGLACAGLPSRLLDRPIAWIGVPSLGTSCLRTAVALLLVALPGTPGCALDSPSAVTGAAPASTGSAPAGSSKVTVRRSTRTMVSTRGMIKNSPGPRVATRRPSRKITPRSYSRVIRTVLPSSTIATIREDQRSEAARPRENPPSRSGKWVYISAPIRT